MHKSSKLDRPAPIETLVLSGNKLSQKGQVKFLESLSTNRTLLELELANCNLGEAAAVLLGEMLQVRALEYVFVCASICVDGEGMMSTRTVSLRNCYDVLVHMLLRPVACLDSCEDLVGSESLRVIKYLRLVLVSMLPRSCLHFRPLFLRCFGIRQTVCGHRADDDA